MALPAATDTSTAGRAAAWALVALSVATTIALAAVVPEVSAGRAVELVWPWVPSLGVEAAFYIDGLGLLFALLISGVGIFIALYSGTYLRGDPHLVRFIVWLGFFEASMLGLVLADDLITLFVFWELTTVSSFMLIGFRDNEEKARRNALQSLLVTGIGGLALLAGCLCRRHRGHLADQRNSGVW